MKRRLMTSITLDGWIAVAISVGIVFLASCHGPKAIEEYDGSHDHVLSNGYSLLHDLVSKQSQLSGLLILKSASPQAKQVIQQITQASTEATQKINDYARHDPRQVLGRLNLPDIEQAARDAIESAATSQLLLAGESFEFTVLLSQYEATKYGAFLADQIANADDLKTRQQWLASFAESYRSLHEQVLALLAGPPEGSSN